MRVLLVTEGSSDRDRLRVLIDTRPDADGRPIELVGHDDSMTYLSKVAVTGLAREHKIRFSGAGLDGVLRQALLVVRRMKELGGQWDRVVVVFDLDDPAENADPDMPALDGLLDGVALGFARQCVEAWVVEGHEPTETERRHWKRELGFDPFRSPERLSHKEHAPKSAKRLVEALGMDDEVCLRRLWSTGGRLETGSAGLIAGLRNILS